MTQVDTEQLEARKALASLFSSPPATPPEAALITTLVAASWGANPLRFTLFSLRELEPTYSEWASCLLRLQRLLYPANLSEDRLDEADDEILHFREVSESLAQSFADEAASLRAQLKEGGYRRED